MRRNSKGWPSKFIDGEDYLPPVPLRTFPATGENKILAYLRIETRIWART
jgi:hypothetical protein